MLEIGYALSGEEHPPLDLVRNARSAEEAGFSFAMISDHYHPWVDRQGHSPLVWSVLGAIATATDRLVVGTAVTCPTIRIHPAIIAQAAATTAAMMPGRFFLGLGTGEALNEHIVAERWPSADERRSMLKEAVEVIRALWTGELVSHHGPSYRVEDARLYTLPPEPPPIAIAAGGPAAARLAGGIGDGLITTAPDRETRELFEREGGQGKPRYGKVTLCYAEREDEARRTAYEWWPTGAIGGELGQELPLPRHFEQAAELVSEEDVARTVFCGPDPQPIIDAVREYVDAGYERVCLQQVGPDQDAFFGFFERELGPGLAELSRRAA